MMVKDVSGNDFNAASNGKANAALTTGVIGTTLGSLAFLGANGLGSVLGGNNQCVVAEKEYYTDTIANMKEFFTYAQGVSDRICDLEQRVAVDETSIAKNFEFMAAQNEWQNKFFDEKMRYADLLEQCRIDKATCKCIKGEVYASPSNLADPYVGRPMVLGSFPATFCGDGWNSWNTWGNGCGCGCGYGY